MFVLWKMFIHLLTLVNTQVKIEIFKENTKWAKTKTLIHARIKLQ